MRTLAGIFLLLSGMSALTYQLVWVRLLRLTLGTTASSVSTVLAAFFLGLALGSILAPRLSRGRDAWLTYLGLELAIGVSGLLLLLALPRLGEVVAAMPSQHVVFRFLLAFTSLLIPTVCMGALFPILTGVVLGGSNRVGPGLGWFYACNTGGAVLGVAGTAFWWVPAGGLAGATLVAVTLNFLIFATGFAARRFVTSASAGPGAPAGPPDGTGPGARGSRAALAVLVGTGFVSLAVEVGWTRTLVLFTGGTIYGFALILGVFLAGMALGSLAIRSRLDRIDAPYAWLAGGTAALGLSLLATRAALTWLPAWFDRLASLSLLVGRLYQVAVVAAAILLPTFLFGALFPLALSVYCRNRRGLARPVGRAYAVNTIASVLGSLAAGFWWIPAWGTNATLTITALVALALPALFLTHLESSRARGALVATIAMGIALALWGPQLRFEPLIAAVKYGYDEQARAGSPPDFLFLREGKEGVISVVTYDDRMARVQNNGLNESILDLAQRHWGSRSETLLGIVPYLLHDRARGAFVVGYGGGVTARALLDTDLETVRVVELEPVMVQAVTSVLGSSARLDDARLEIVFDDARNRLLVEPERWDLVVSQPSHPWLGGASSLFTREFFALVRSRLAEEGVFAQWLNLFRMDVETLGSILRAFFGTFSEGFTLVNFEDGDLILVGADRPLRFSPAEIDRKLGESRLGSTLVAAGVEDAIDVLAMFSLSRQEAWAFCGSHRPNTDGNLISEVRLAGLPNAGWLPPGQDPNVLLRDWARYGIGAIVPESELTETLAALAGRLIGRGDLPAARIALSKLRERDPARADSLGTLSNRARIPVPPPDSRGPG